MPAIDWTTPYNAAVAALAGTSGNDYTLGERLTATLLQRGTYYDSELAHDPSFMIDLDAQRAQYSSELAAWTVLANAALAQANRIAILAETAQGKAPSPSATTLADVVVRLDAILATTPILLTVAETLVVSEHKRLVARDIGLEPTAPVAGVPRLRWRYWRQNPTYASMAAVETRLQADIDACSAWVASL
jgi:hypothetical protein